MSRAFINENWNPPEPPRMTDEELAANAKRITDRIEAREARAMKETQCPRS